MSKVWEVSLFCPCCQGHGEEYKYFKYKRNADRFAKNEQLLEVENIMKVKKPQYARLEDTPDE